MVVCILVLCTMLLHLRILSLSEIWNLCSFYSGNLQFSEFNGESFKAYRMKMLTL